MNNVYSSEPSFFDNFDCLIRLLGYFGHYTGRYLNTYPSDWIELVKTHLSTLRELGKIDDSEYKQAFEYLNMSINQGVLVHKSGIPYSENKPWIENAIPLLKFGIESILVNRKTPIKRNDRVISINNFIPPPTEGGRIDGTVEEYLRVSKPLLRSSSEIILIDPYLNPKDRFVKVVLEEFLKYISQTQKCESMIIWTRYQEVIKVNSHQKKYDYRNDSVNKLIYKLSNIIKLSGIDDEFKLKMILVNDWIDTDRLHDRNLISLKGGLELGQGFQIQKKGRRVRADPIAKKTHDELLTIFADGNNDLNKKNTINCIGSKCFVINNDKIEYS